MIIIIIMMIDDGNDDDSYDDADTNTMLTCDGSCLCWGSPAQPVMLMMMMMMMMMVMMVMMMTNIICNTNVLCVAGHVLTVIVQHSL